MTRGAIELEVGDVSNMEVRVYARFRSAESDRPSPSDSIVLRGTLRGPYCETAHTLPADYAFRDLGPAEAAAEAVVTDPCLWSEELPHLYQANVEALNGDIVVAEYHGVVGLRRTSPTKNWDGIK